MIRTPPPVRAGYSLVEMLVVMTLIALVTGGVWLTVSSGQQAGQAEADRLAVALMRAEQEAILSGDFIGMDVRSDGAQFLRYRGGEWQADTVILAGGIQLGEGQFLILRDGQAGDGPGPDIWFDPAGASEPAGLVLEAEGRRYRIEMSAGSVRVVAEG